MQPITSLADIVDDATFAAVERQRRLSDVVGADGPYGQRWDVDFDRSVLSFTGADGVLDTPVNLVGSASPAAGTWLWGWADLDGSADQESARSLRARQLGERFEIPELRGMAVETTREEVTITAADGRVVVFFDDLDRIVRLTGDLGVDGLPPA